MKPREITITADGTFLNFTIQREWLRLEEFDRKGDLNQHFRSLEGWIIRGLFKDTGNLYFLLESQPSPLDTKISKSWQFVRITPDGDGKQTVYSMEVSRDEAEILYSRFARGNATLWDN